MTASKLSAYDIELQNFNNPTGALTSHSSRIVLTRVIFASNAATGAGYGGALSLRANSTAVLSHCKFSSNSGDSQLWVGGVQGEVGGLGAKALVLGAAFEGARPGTSDIIVAEGPGVQGSEVEVGACGPGYSGLEGGELAVPAGTAALFEEAPKSYDCRECREGKFKESVGLQGCSACRRGKFSEGLGAESESDCEFCPVGTTTSGTASSGSSACSSCLPGKAAADPTAGCQECAFGKYAASHGQVACDDCGKGTYGDGVGLVECEACGRGKYNKEVGRRACMDCPGGSYGDETGLDDVGGCKDCLAGTYSTGGATNCTQCQGDSVSQPKSAKCTTCGLMEYSTGADCALMKVMSVEPTHGHSTKGGETLTITGSNFAQPNVSVPLTVSVDGNDCPITLQTLSTLECTVPPGSGRWKVVSVSHTTMGIKVEATDQVTYLEPAIRSITGCPSNAMNGTSECPTVGGTHVNILGSNFGPSWASVSVTVDGESCTQVEHDPDLPHESISCYLPPAVGKDVKTVVTVDSLSGEANLVTYKKPGVDGFTGCSQSNAVTGESLCPRTGGDLVTITGNDFGPKIPYIFIGGKICERSEATLPSGSTNHNTVIVSLPIGSGSGQLISVLQNGGLVGEGVALVDYVPCEPGETNKVDEATQNKFCVPCLAGRYSTEQEAQVCKTCLEGYFTTGLTHCEICPDFTTSNAGDSSCVCKDGFVTLDDGTCACGPGEFLNLNMADGTCQKCPENQYKEGTNLNTTCTRCDDFMEDSITNITGASSASSCMCEIGAYASSASDETSIDALRECLPCVDGMDCSEKGQSMDNLILEAGYWRANEETIDIRQCPKENLCLGGNHEEICPEYNGGPYCLVCSEGAGGNWKSECQSCEDTQEAMTQAGIAFGIVVAVVLMCGAIFYFCIPQNSQHSISHTLKIVLAGCQILSAIPQVFDVNMPDGFEEFLEKINFINLDIFGQLSAGCIATVNFYDVLFWTTLTPLIMAGVFILGFVVQRVSVEALKLEGRKKKKKMHEVKHMWISLLFLLSYLTYPGASISIFTMLSPCDNIEDKSFFKADYSIRCDSRAYPGWRYYAGGMSLVYPLGVPLLYGILLFKARRKINPSEGEDIKEKLELREANKGEIKLISFLWVAYTPDCWWFEIWECARRLLMTGGLVFVDQGSPLQVCVGLLITFFSLFNLAWFKPYISRRDNWLACFQQINQFLVLIVVMLILTKRDEDIEDGTLSWILILLYTATGIALFITGALQILSEVDENKKEFEISTFFKDNLERQGSSMRETTSDGADIMVKSRGNISGGEMGPSEVPEGEGRGSMEMTENPIGEITRKKTASTHL